MCGLFGFARHPDEAAISTKQMTELAYDLIERNAARGIDSVGLCCVYDTGRAAIIKKAIHPYMIPHWSPTRKALEEAISKNPLAVIGHTRGASVGQISDKNAHPFRKGSVVGAHNGGIWNWKDLAQELEAKDLEVDSEIIFELLTRLQPKEALEKLEGSYALTWWDERAPTLIQFARHSNPLHIFQHKTQAFVAWSSEKHHLERATEGVPGEIYWFREHTLHALDIREIRPVNTDKLSFFVENWRYAPLAKKAETSRSSNSALANWNKNFERVFANTDVSEFDPQKIVHRDRKNAQCCNKRCRKSTRNGLPLCVNNRDMLCEECVRIYHQEKLIVNAHS